MPYLYQSNRATPATKKVGPIDDADLAGHILRMCPGTWQAQYELKAETVPQCVCDLLDDLEKIEKAFLMERDSPLRRARQIPANPTRGRWYHPMNLFPRKFARWQSIVPYARSMGALMQ